MDAKILVVANKSCPDPELRELLLRRGSAGGEVLVVAPALDRLPAAWTSDQDGAKRRARERVEEIVRVLRSEGVKAQGAVGNRDPLVAIESALRWFPADAIVIATRPPRRSRWLARSVVAQARRRFAVPVIHVVATRAADPGRARPVLFNGAADAVRAPVAVAS
jgi:GABA permease